MDSIITRNNLHSEDSEDQPSTLIPEDTGTMNRRKQVRYPEHEKTKKNINKAIKMGVCYKHEHHPIWTSCGSLSTHSLSLLFYILMFALSPVVDNCLLKPS